jgi:solute carrier family 25 folate transporter 32
MPTLTFYFLLTTYYFWQDHAFAGIGAGTVAVLCMNPLDLLKVKFQVSTRAPGSGGGIGRGIWLALRDIHASEGWRGLYRGLGPNVAGNASSWGLYFLLCVAFFIPFCFLFLHFCSFFISYNQLKRRATVEAPDKPLSASQYLLFSAEASSHFFYVV